jgi:hypothetical protein
VTSSTASSGETLAKVMRTLVEYGEAFGATSHGQGDGAWAPGDQLWHLDPRRELPPHGRAHQGRASRPRSPSPWTRVPSTTQTSRLAWSRRSWVRSPMASRTPTSGSSVPWASRTTTPSPAPATCPRLATSPKRGDVLSWAESSAVVYANSVLGARGATGTAASSTSLATSWARSRSLASSPTRAARPRGSWTWSAPRGPRPRCWARPLA